MNQLKSQLALLAQEALQTLYGLETEAPEWQPTRKEFEGDLTLVVFPYLRWSRQKPEETARQIGDWVTERLPEGAKFNVVKGFLNLSLGDAYWISALLQHEKQGTFGPRAGKNKTLLVEYSSPNTNKPLHLGHVRNNLLGYAVAQILREAGYTTRKVQIINDRGIHICKSMLAWQKFGANETPQSSGMKGDHLVGKYYVAFDKAHKANRKALMEEEGLSEEAATEKEPLLQEARQMLQRWEAGDEETVALWRKMNGWVYEGFEETYRRLGVDFDKYYYESETYLLGREVVMKGLENGLFYRKEDGSVWCDLAEEKLGKKLLLRRDGTSVYMTQDIGTAIQRYEDFGLEGMVYVVGNEQDHHFKVLFAILKKLGYQWAHNLYHLSYGMVDLPTGKMKSREGTVVDADDLMDEMEATARSISEELGKTEGMSETEKADLYHTVGLGALKYFILRVDPRKRMTFNPEESVDFHGDTGPFIQYTHARIQTLLRKAEKEGLPKGDPADYQALELQERELIKALFQYPVVLDEAAQDMAPSTLAHYVYDLTKRFNGLYQQVPILSDADTTAVAFRLELARATALAIKRGMRLLGIAVPERM